MLSLQQWNKEVANTQNKAGNHITTEGPVSYCGGDLEIIIYNSSKTSRLAMF